MTELSKADEFVNSEFIKFIKRKDLYGNIEHKIKEAFKASLDRFLEEISRGDIHVFLGAFAWSRSEEGYEFWNEINEEWLEVINDKLMKNGNLEEEVKSRNRKFIKFLKDKGIYTKFNLELMEDRGISIIDYLGIGIHCLELSTDQVVSSFDWYRSSDGWDFWNKVDEEWQEICTYGEEFKYGEDESNEEK